MPETKTNEGIPQNSVARRSPIAIRTSPQSHPKGTVNRYEVKILGKKFQHLHFTLKIG